MAASASKANVRNKSLDVGVSTSGPSPPLQDEQKLNKLVIGSSQVFLKISSVFPFDFFPDDLTIDDNKVSFIIREFFFSEDIYSIIIKSIKDVEIECGPFFATLKIVPEWFPGKIVQVNYLKKSEAIEARRLILGLICACREGIDVTKLDQDKVKKMVEKVGKIKEVEDHIHPFI